MVKSRKIATLAIAGVLSAAGAANAGSLALTWTDAFGNVFNSGWVASWSPVFDPYLSLNTDGVMNVDGKAAIVIEKFYNFTEASVNNGFIEPVVIVFQQVTSTATEYIVIADETLVNNTGQPWGGFRMTIQGGSTGTTDDVRFDSVKTLDSGFGIDPFTTIAFTQNDQIMTLGGGIVPAGPPGNVFFPGNPGELYVVATAPTTSGAKRVFALKEQPLPIPLPAAAWTGLSALAGLAVLGAAKRVRKA